MKSKLQEWLCICQVIASDLEPLLSSIASAQVSHMGLALRFVSGDGVSRTDGDLLMGKVRFVLLY